VLRLLGWRVRLCNSGAAARALSGAVGPVRDGECGDGFRGEWW